MKHEDTHKYWGKITKKECSALRGIAIMAICLHNYCHILPHSVQENEFSYDIHHYELFWNSIHFHDFFIQFFSYWGHHGVSVFVFLSGYGLSIKYSDKISVNRKKFVYEHFKKLALPLLGGTILFQFILFLENDSFNCFISTLLQCTMLLNIGYGYEDYIVPGPYWYFGMTLQLYIFYIFFIYKRPVIFSLIPFIISFIGLALLERHQGILIWAKYNLWGWLLPFYIGLYTKHIRIKSYKAFSLPALLFISILILLFEAHFNSWLWIPGIVVVLFLLVIKVLPPRIITWGDYLGNISLYIFVIHPIIRRMTITLADTYNNYIGLLIYIFATITISHLVANITKSNIWYHISKT